MSRTISTEECDTFDGVRNLFQQVFDDAEQTNAKVCQMATPGIEAMKKSKKKSKKDGRVSVFMLIVLCVIFLLVGTAKGKYVTTDINSEIAANHDLLAEYLRDSFANIKSNSFLFTPTTTANAPPAAQGLVYFNSNTSSLQVSLDGSNFSPIDTAGGVGLNAAYDFGSAGGGRTITATDGAVQITNTDNDSVSLLELTYSGSSTGDGLTITMSVGSGDCIEFENTGTGDDIEGTGDLWSVQKDGECKFVKGVFSGDVTITGNAADIVFDVSDDELLIEDDAVLSFGDGADLTITWDQTNLVIEQLSQDAGVVTVGATNSFDWIFYDNGGSGTATFNSGEATLSFNAYDIQLQSDDVLAFGDSDEFTIEYDDDATDNLLIVAVNANDAVQFGDGTSSSTDVKMMASTNDDFVLFDSSANELFFEDCDLKINEGAQIEFSVADESIDWTIDVSTDDTLLFLPALTDGTASYNIGDASNTSDVLFFGESASTVVFDAEANKVTFDVYDIEVLDTSNLVIGSDDEFTIDNNSEVLRIIASDATDDFQVVLGITEEGMDLKVWGAAAAAYFLWDASANALWIEGADIFLGDSDLLVFGDAIGTGDIKIYATGTDLIIDGIVASTGTVAIGVTDEGLDFKLWSKTAGEGILWDASDEALEFTAVDITLDTSSFINRVTQQYVQTIGDNCHLGSSGSGWIIAADSDASLTTLPASQTSEELVIPITIPLKVGWIITAWTLNGQIESAGQTCTVDAQMYTQTDASGDVAIASVGSGMSQLSKTNDFKIVAGEGGLTETVAAGESYLIKVLATTGSATDVALASITVTVTEI